MARRVFEPGQLAESGAFWVTLGCRASLVPHRVELLSPSLPTSVTNCDTQDACRRPAGSSTAAASGPPLGSRWGSARGGQGQGGPRPEAGRPRTHSCAFRLPYQDLRGRGLQAQPRWDLGDALPGKAQGASMAFRARRSHGWWLCSKRCVSRTPSCGPPTAPVLPCHQLFLLCCALCGLARLPHSSRKRSRPRLSDEEAEAERGGATPAGKWRRCQSQPAGSLWRRQVPAEVG